MYVSAVNVDVSIRMSAKGNIGQILLILTRKRV